MVFESIVAELLNKVIGEYIENLDYSQLKLSLWGGKNAQNNFAFHLANGILYNNLFTFRRSCVK